MNKQGLLEKVSEKNGMSKKENEKILKTYLEAIFEGLKADGKVQITGVGTLEVKERAARKGRNPRTGEEMDIPASRTIGYKVGSKVKKMINE